MKRSIFVLALTLLLASAVPAVAGNGSCLADITGDGNVDLSDLSALSVAFGTSDPAVIAHTTIPRITNGQKLIIPSDKESMTATLDKLLTAGPRKLALHLPNAQSGTPENAELAARSLDALGVNYTKHDNIASADFQPYQGSLIVIDNP